MPLARSPPEEALLLQGDATQCRVPVQLYKEAVHQTATFRWLPGKKASVFSSADAVKHLGMVNMTCSNLSPREVLLQPLWPFSAFTPTVPCPLWQGHSIWGGVNLFQHGWKSLGLRWKGYSKYLLPQFLQALLIQKPHLSLIFFLLEGKHFIFAAIINGW